MPHERWSGGLSETRSSSPIARDSATSLGMRILQLGSDAGILVLTARGLGVEGRGVYTLVLVGTMLAQAPVLGIAAPLSSELAHGRRPEQVLRGSTAVLAAVWGSVVALVLLPFVAWETHDLLFVIIATPPLLMLSLLQSITLTRGHVVRYGLLFIAPSLVSLGALAVGLIAAPDDPDVAIGCWAVAQWIVPVIALVAGRPRFPFRGQRSMYRSLLVRGAPISLATGVSRLNYRATTIVVAVMLPIGDVGRYSVAATGGETLLQLSRPIATAAYRSVVSAPTEEAAGLTLRVFRHSALLVAVGGIAGTIAALVLVEPVLGADYAGVWLVFALLVPGMVLFGASEVLRTFFTVRLERSREFVTASLLSIVASVAVSAALVPVVGISGAAIGASVGYAASSIHFVTRFRASGGEQRWRSYIPGRTDLRRYGTFLSTLSRRPRAAGKDRP
jgi:O-antigen/teichoic acid export membrane protein